MNQSLNSLLEDTKKMLNDRLSGLKDSSNTNKIREGVLANIEASYSLAISDALKAKPERDNNEDAGESVAYGWNNGTDTYEYNIKKLKQ